MMEMDTSESTAQQLPMDSLPVADPIPFPNPVIRRCNIRKFKVEIAPNVVESKAVLESANGFFYEIGSTLKNAIFGKVVHAIQLQRDLNRGEELIFLRTEEQRAIKVYSRSALRTLQGRVQENPLQEITAMQFIGCSHENVMGQIECAIDDENIYSVMKFCPGGEFFDFISDNGPMTDAEARIMFKQLCSGMAYLHSLGVGHRDMSLENVLYDGEKLFVIIDFGMCLRMKPLEQQQQMQQQMQNGSNQFCLVPKQSICGKRNYIAPEVFREDRVFDPRICDIWAMGVILFISLTGIPPVDMATRADERFLMISAGRLQEMVDRWGLEVNKSAVHLVQMILNPDPVARPTIAQILQHPWMCVED